MAGPPRRPGSSGAVRRGHRRTVAGLPADVIEKIGGSSGPDHGITTLTGDVTAGPGDGSQAATIGVGKVTTSKIADAAVTTVKIADANVTTPKIADANVTAAKLAAAAVVTANIADANVTLAKLVDLLALSVLGRAGNTSGVMAAITAANDGDVLRRAGTALGFGAIATAGLTDAAVTLAKLANLANHTVIGRDTAGAGVPEAVTLTQLLDWISGSVAQGDILYRGSAGWQRLAASAGKFLQSFGAGVDPAWGLPTGGSSPLAVGQHIEYAFTVVSGAMLGLNCSNGTVSGTIGGTWPAAGSILASGPYSQIGTSAATNSTGSLTSGSSGLVQLLSFAWDFDLTFIMRTDASAISSVRYLFGVGTSNFDTDTIASGGYIGVRYSTGAGDSGWVGVTYDGTQAVTTQIATIATATRYVIRIQKVGGTVSFSVNGGTAVSTSTHVPVNNVYAGITGRVTALTTSVRSMWMRSAPGIYCDFAT